MLMVVWANGLAVSVLPTNLAESGWLVAFRFSQGPLAGGGIPDRDPGTYADPRGLPNPDRKKRTKYKKALNQAREGVPKSR